MRLAILDFWDFFIANVFLLLSAASARRDRRAMQHVARARVEHRVRIVESAARGDDHAAVEEGIRVCQLQGSGQWVATSGSQSGIAYEVLVTGNVAHGCDCGPG